MRKYHCKEAFVLFCLGHLFFFTEAVSHACETNEDAYFLIEGDTENAVRNFLSVIHNENVIMLSGDSPVHKGGCRASNQQNKNRKQRTHDGRMWILDCWEPFECKMIEEIRSFRLLPTTASSTAPVQVRTVFLPLDQTETSAYTFLPLITEDNVLFVTSLLSGCSFFVAKPNPDQYHCNLIIIHTNYRCDERPRNYDYNYHQAIASLEEVQSTNPRCRYQIERRWAENQWRSVIDAAGYHYPTQYYDFSSKGYYSFLYGHRLGITTSAWTICIKLLQNDVPTDICYAVS